ncbi:MAG: aminomethyl-transferring glycine dehydrogenase subunit GcvPA [Prevotellaceae bacterium]|nr:aminomethyl-transferring glycine dehydrogenase subunit GcvPA [Prevotellaceae bacterium]
MKNFRYFPHTEDDLQEMLKATGSKSVHDLFADIPEAARFKGDYNLPDALSETDLRLFFEQLTALGNTQQLVCFAGAGCYDHYAPSVVQNLIQRSEFLTSYTPYQAEISQGTLHYIFEYQSMIAELTGMDIANASMYDGATATAEAAMMAWGNAKKANRVLMSETVDPKVRRVVETYAHFHGFPIELVPAENGALNRSALDEELAEGGVAGLIVQQPNYYGIVEDYTGIADAIHEQKGLFVVNANPSDLAILKTPAEWGADVAAGEGQSLGIPMTFGGPGVGYMACTEKLMRKLPGRIVGQTLDNRGQRAFVLTLQAREQHIRRQKATSNICSNQSLMALYVTIYLSLMGKEGLREVAEMSYAGAHSLRDKLIATGMFKDSFPGQPFFNEFCVNYEGDLDALLDECVANGYLAGVKVGDNTLMLAVTEQRSPEEINELVEIIQQFNEEEAKA